MSRLNFLLITADDMNWDSPGCFGGQTPDVTPNIDRLAGEGVRFEFAHVTIAVCQPSRECLMTGRYPHRNGGEGFEPIRSDVPTLGEHLSAAGYINGILGKVTHCAPKEKYCWSFDIDMGELGQGRDPQLYYRGAKDFITRADAAGKPFFLMANSHDPHRPFTGSEAELRHFADDLDRIPDPSRIYDGGEIEVPGFLPDLPDVRKEIAQYYGSVRRCDDTVGAVLRALEESGHAGDTVVMFLSDNGMAVPFAKTNCYLHSTKTPWLVRMPGAAAGSVDKRHFVSGIDFMPTVLDLAGVAGPGGMDGRSFAALLRGDSETGRERVFTAFHETSAKRRYEMRCVQDARFGYIFNAWSDGETRFRNESQSGLTFAAMEQAAQSDPQIAARVQHFLYRTPEELYNFAADPDALHNLAGAPAHQKTLMAMRNLLADWMGRSGDHQADAFAKHCGT